MTRVPPDTRHRHGEADGIVKWPTLQALSALVGVCCIYGYFVDTVPVHLTLAVRPQRGGACVDFGLGVFLPAYNDGGLGCAACVVARASCAEACSVCGRHLHSFKSSGTPMVIGPACFLFLNI